MAKKAKKAEKKSEKKAPKKSKEPKAKKATKKKAKPMPTAVTITPEGREYVERVPAVPTFTKAGAEQILTVPRTDFTSAFLASDESLQRQVVEFYYKHYLGRTPSADEVISWIQGLKTGATYNNMASDFTASAEYFEHKCGGDLTKYIDQMYMDVLGRPADAEGLQSWTIYLQGGAAATPNPINGAGKGGQTWATYNDRNVALIGTGLRPPANAVILGDSILAEMQYGDGAPIWAQSYAPFNVFNLAIPGLATMEVLWQIEQKQVLACGPKAVQILIGTNNGGIYGQRPVDVAAAISAIISNLLAQMPKLRILLTAVLPRGLPGDPMRPWVQDLNNQIKVLRDDTHVWWADLTAAYCNPESGQLNTALYDNEPPPGPLHLNEAGLAAFRDGTFPTLVQLVQAP
jgi:hypothetical protein